MQMSLEYTNNDNYDDASGASKQEAGEHLAMKTDDSAFKSLEHRR